MRKETYFRRIIREYKYADSIVSYQRDSYRMSNSSLSSSKPGTYGLSIEAEYGAYSWSRFNYD